MSSKFLFGIDPSYSRTGIAGYRDGKIVISEVRGKEVLEVDSFSKSFDGIFRESKAIAQAITREIRAVALELGYSGDMRGTLISECPPPQGQYAPGLYALDTRLFGIYKNLGLEVYKVYPNYLMHIHGKRKYEKSESVVLAKMILEHYDYKILSKRLSHDESESVIFLSRLLYKEGLLPQEVVKKIPNIVNEKESLFEY